VPARSVSEFVALAKETPVQLSYASGGPGTPSHLLVELFKSTTGIQMMHIPYKGSAQAVADVLAGHVPVTFADALSSLPLIEQGKLRALGVSTKARLASAPQIPPLAEAGVPGFDAAAWIMVVAPARTPRDIVSRLHAELKRISGLPDVQQQLLKFGVMSIVSPPVEQLQPFINSEIARWAEVVRRAGIAGSE